jgi:membrane fusion protein (multidrug efflux system)
MSTTTIEEPATIPDKIPARATSASAAPAKKKLYAVIERYKKPAMYAAGIIALVVVLFYAYDAYTHEETDDAYVTGHLHDISTRINGVVTDVRVDDNQFVHKGDVLVGLDPMEYQAIEAAAKANYDVAQSNLNRLQPLIATHAVAPEDVDKARSTRDVDLAQDELAKLQIAYSTITAPADGYIGRKNVEVGNRVSSGQTLMVVVDPNLWIVANFKETQLARMKAGQPVTISIDSIPDRQRVRASACRQFDRKLHQDRPARAGENRLQPRLGSRLRETYPRRRIGGGQGGVDGFDRKRPEIKVACFLFV